jgi:hypothetical protein
MACGWLEQTLEAPLRCAWPLMTRECVDVHCSALVLILMTGLASLDDFLNMLARLGRFVRQVFLHRLMNGVVNYAGFALLMPQNVSHRDPYW